MSNRARRPPGELASARTRLRVPRASEPETRAFLAGLESSREHLHPWLTWARKRLDTADVKRVSTRARRKFAAGEFFVWRVFDSEGRLVGTVDLHSIDWDVPRCEIGFWLFAFATGRGLATEAVGAVVDAAWELSMERIEARCDVRNAASRRVLERLGFAWEGTLRHSDRDGDGMLCDDHVYALLRPED